MVLFRGLGVVAAIVLWLWAIFDLVTTEEGDVRNMPKHLWLLLVIFVPLVGAVAWLAVGRPQRAPQRGRAGRMTPPAGPDDSPDFLRGIDDQRRRLQRWEEDLKRREEEYRRRQGGEGTPPGS